MTTPEKTLPRDLIGITFGRWTVILFVCNKWHTQYWKCLCRCGNTKSVSRSSLIKGTSRSCGCLNRESASARAYKHGYGCRTSRTYRIWCGMRTRCSNSNASNWKDYGGRGIHFCSEWEDFSIFLHDMGECPPNLTLERIDVDQGYSPANCKWASYKEQNMNKRKTVCCKHGHVREGNTSINSVTGNRYCVLCAQGARRIYRLKTQQMKRGSANGG